MDEALRGLGDSLGCSRRPGGSVQSFALVKGIELVRRHPCSPRCSVARIDSLKGPPKLGKQIVRLLLAHGADPGLRSDFDDMTPLEAARRYRRTEFIALLQAQGAKEERKPFWWRWLPV